MTTDSSAKLFRPMYACAIDGYPACNVSDPCLRARIPIDIEPNEDGHVEGNCKGISVVLDLKWLPPGLRPESHRGYWKGPVFFINSESVSGDLTYTRDPKRPNKHGFIEPTKRMKLDSYQEALCDTRLEWEKEA